ncbi:regulatory LuxR family protein [Mucilaginibacter gracilis]|uniref:Regulatory LuxR family protein n=1 Tax=Mucilaginibacter gracilis TaxID=423350 RepID=A0A495J0E4_9SPHI|nr:LuxR family transcriptional regulator [Mucilaginibacter gracilis]RKR82397.1 regulatory LuxR family protein [Mucilaginibacter gracilis]
MRTIKIQLPLISWIFILLDISLFCFQFIRVYFHPGEGRHWRATMLCLLIIIYNCISGNLSALWVHISINVAVLFLVVYLLTKKVRDVSDNSNKKVEEPPAETPDIPFQMLEITEAMAVVFLENCHLFQFTAREIDVCLLLAKGMTYTEIAETLHISNSTVDSHAQKIYKKSGVNSRVALLNKFYQKPGQ